MIEADKSKVAVTGSPIVALVYFIVAVPAGVLGPVFIFMGVWVIPQIQDHFDGGDLFRVLSCLATGVFCTAIAIRWIIGLPKFYSGILSVTAMSLGLLSGPIAFGLIALATHEFPLISYPLNSLAPVSLIASVLFFSILVRFCVAQTGGDKAFAKVGIGAPIAWCIVAVAFVGYAITHFD